jgi:hypothetical protein
MKALKEKRVSLRSLLRRGLVILSLFALVFASCSDSDDGGTGTDPGPTNPPAGPSIVSLTILQQPQEESFQGLPPNLKGLIVEVHWSDGKIEQVNDYTKFTTVPGYADEASDPLTSETDVPTPKEGFGLMYIGHTEAQTNNLKIPFVVAASAIDITQVNPVTWFSDQRPDVSGLTYNVAFEAGWSGMGARWTGTTNGVATGPKTGYKKVAQPMTPVYPLIDYKDAERDKFLTAIVGRDGTGKTGDKDNKVETTFGITNYYGVAAVEFAGFDNPQNYFDDEVNVFFTNNSLDKNKAYNELKKSGAKFKVSYFDPKGNGNKLSDKTNTYTLDEFFANAQWYNARLGGNSAMAYMIQSIIIGSDSTTDYKINAAYESMGNVFKLGGDENLDDGKSWFVRLDYTPWRYNTSGSQGQVNVPFEMYTFDGDIFAIKDVPGPVTIWGSFGTKAMDEQELKAIKDKWHLEGTYAKEGVRGTIRKEIDLTAQMFYDGYFGASALNGWTSLNTSWATNKGTQFHPNASYGAGYNSMITAPGLIQGSNGVRTDFSLPVYYRGGQAFDDEGIIVDLLAPK